MKTIKSSKDITTLEVGDKVVFGDLKYEVSHGHGYFLNLSNYGNDRIFIDLNISKRDFVKNLGITTLSVDWSFPEVKSLEALTAIVSALFKEYEKQNELPKTWEEFCKRNKMGDKRFCLYDGVIIGTGVTQNTVKDSILIESTEEAQAFRALIQLRQLRKAYVKDWEPDWNDTKQYKACIMYDGADFITVYFNDLCSRPLSFPTYELATQFLTNFKDLLEIAKPLL